MDYWEIQYRKEKETTMLTRKKLQKLILERFSLKKTLKEISSKSSDHWAKEMAAKALGEALESPITEEIRNALHL